MKNSLSKAFDDLLVKADIIVGGTRPWDIQIHNPKTLNRIIAKSSVGLGESYMEGWWDCDALDEMFIRLLKVRSGFRPKVNPELVFFYLKARLTNRQTKTHAMSEGKRHYEIGNDLYKRMLDKRMAYTCGFWKGVSTLDEAQEAKLDLTCRKMGLKSGMRVLDIGCGWELLKFAAEKYGVNVVGITVAENQVALAREMCSGLPIEIRLQDYRDVNETFDGIVSLGMFEHVGYKNYREYMQVAHRCLQDGGLFLLHTIGGNRSETEIDAWMDRYIFPNAMLPSIAQIGASIEDLFVMEDWHNLSTDYDRTLMAWHENFQNHWPELSGHYDETFRRMWRYYLQMCAAVFRNRKQQLWQIVLSKNPVERYESVR